MKELAVLVVGAILAVSAVLYAAHGTVDRCPKCGEGLYRAASLTREQAEMLRVPYKINNHKFCVKCGTIE